TPSTLALNARDIHRLLDSAKGNGTRTAELVAAVTPALDAAEAQRPLVYLQIANPAQRQIAATLGTRLRASYQVPGAEVVGTRAPSRTEIRVQGRSDRSLARWMQKIAEEVTGGPVAITTLKNAKPKQDTFEIWLAANLCTN